MWTCRGTLANAESLRDGSLEARHVGADLRHLKRFGLQHAQREAVVVSGAERADGLHALGSKRRADAADDRKSAGEQAERVLERALALGRADVLRRCGVVALRLGREVEGDLRGQGRVVAG